MKIFGRKADRFPLDGCPLGCPSTMPTMSTKDYDRDLGLLIVPAYDDSAARARVRAMVAYWNSLDDAAKRALMGLPSTRPAKKAA